MADTAFGPPAKRGTVLHNALESASEQSHTQFHERRDNVGSFDPGLSSKSKVHTLRPPNESVEEAPDVAVKKRRHRSSGGFLLGGLSRRRGGDTTHDNRHPSASEGTQGKRQRFSHEGSNNASRPHTSEHRLDVLISGSPLSRGLSGSDEHISKRRSVSAVGKRSEGESADRISSGASTSSTLPVDSSAMPQKREHAKPSDVDTAQLVNLALSLNEGRKRHSGVVHLNEEPPTRRVSSFGQFAANSQQKSGHCIPPQITLGVEEGKSNAIPLPGAQHLETPGHATNGNQGISSPLSVVQAHDVLDNSAEFIPSDSTLARVARAKQSMELFYEFRRLLPLLPPLPVSTALAKHKHHQGTGTSHGNRAVGSGRAYNPLQYVRNRKLRLRERKSLNAHAEGWKRPARVKRWIDIIQSGQENGRWPADDSFFLPSLDVARSTSIHEEELETEHEREASPPPRPDCDWIFFPWDLIADAHWMCQGENRYRLEDARGNKIYHPKTEGIGNAPHRRDVVQHSRASSQGSLTHIPMQLPPISSITNQHFPLSQSHKDSLEPSSPGEDARRNRWPNRRGRSREPSFSSDSEWDRQSRKSRAKKPTRADLDHLALERHMTNRMNEEAAEMQGLNSSPGTDGLGSGTSSTGGNFPEAASREEQRKRPTVGRRIQSEASELMRLDPAPRSSLDDRKIGHTRLSSSDFGSTGSSPPATSALPVELQDTTSPTSSPRVGPQSRKKLLPKWSPFGRIRSQSLSSHHHMKSDKNDEDLKPSALLSRSTNPDMSSIGSDQLHDQRQKLLSPFTYGEPSASSGDRRTRPGMTQSHSSRQDSELSNTIAEDISPRHSHERTPVSVSSHVSLESNIDNINASDMERSPLNLSRTPTRETPSRAGRSPMKVDRPRYFLDNLPSFKSHIDRDDHSPRSPAGSPGLEPIPEKQLGHQGTGSLDSTNHLEPPKAESNLHFPLNGSEQGGSGSVSRASSPIRDVRCDDPAQGEVNESLGLIGRAPLLTTRPHVTALARYDATPGIRDTASGAITGGRGTPNKKSMSDDKAPISASDLVRVRAIFISSGVKGSGVARNATTVPETPSLLIRELSDVVEDDLPPVALEFEHVAAARLLMQTMEKSKASLRQHEEYFANHMTASLAEKYTQGNIRMKDDISMQADRSADEAESFSAELVTTQTLAVKELSDQIHTILRRRRHKTRWLRHVLWAMIEWMVLVVLWLLWFAVSLVRIGRMTTCGAHRALKWLFWF